MPKPTAEITLSGTTHQLTREAVETAASSLTPANGARGLNYVWYALVGTNLYYVVALAAAAAGQPLPSRPTDYVRDARLALKALGIPIMCWANDELLDKGHPLHTA
ncbi:hypothetical protein [Streptomyces sp. NPDC047976]|uniref:hypothetical protein n=1 Tax=Streptomyces sp. NPDC047976 TaxID=3155746 RepID=UPI0034380132